MKIYISNKQMNYIIITFYLVSCVPLIDLINKSHLSHSRILFADICLIIMCFVSYLGLSGTRIVRNYKEITSFHTLREVSFVLKSNDSSYFSRSINVDQRSSGSAIETLKEEVLIQRGRVHLTFDEFSTYVSYENWSRFANVYDIQVRAVKITPLFGKEYYIVQQVYFPEDEKMV